MPCWLLFCVCVCVLFFFFLLFSVIHTLVFSKHIFSFFQWYNDHKIFKNHDFNMKIRLHPLLTDFSPAVVFNVCNLVKDWSSQSIWGEFLFQLGLESSYQSIDKYSRKGKEVWNNKLRLSVWLCIWVSLRKMEEYWQKTNYFVIASRIVSFNVVNKCHSYQE